MNRNILATILLVACAVLAGLGVASAAVGGSATAKQVTEQAVEQPDNTVYWRWPDDERDAFIACFNAEREARNIPGDLASYRVWWAANEGTPAEIDWTAAHDACVAAHLWKHGRWNWDYMVRVN